MPRSGFTLIELMVVITIIAIMAAVGMVIYGSVQSNGRDSKRIQDIQEIQKSLETYFTLTQTYPTSLSNAATYFQSGSVPTDPTNSGSYVYQYKFGDGGTADSTCGQKYLVCAKLENCGGNKCTRGNLSGSDNGCSPANQSGTKTLYCVNSLN